MKLTKATVSRLPLSEDAGKSDVLYFDDDLAGFAVRIREGGKRTWVIQYRAGAKQRRLTLGDVKKLDADKAREAAKQRLAQVTLGADPALEKAEAHRKAAVTLGAIVETYLAWKQPRLRPKTYADTARYLRGCEDSRHWRPLHTTPVHTVDRRMVAARLAEIATESGAVAATRARAALSALFSWAIREGIADLNPVVGTNKPAEPMSRDRVLSDAELAEIWDACRDDDYGRIVKLAMLTAARREEIGGLNWEEFDSEGAALRLPSDRTKNKRAHVIPLAPLALSIISSVPHREDRNGKERDHLFGEGAGGFSGWSKAKAGLETRILAARKLAAKKSGIRADMKPMAPWHLHDLRRTAVTVMADRLGVLPHVIEAAVNHVSGHKSGVAGIYNRATYDREVKAALAVWADHVRSIVEGGERKIVPFGAGHQRAS